MHLTSVLPAQEALAERLSHSPYHWELCSLAIRHGHVLAMSEYPAHQTGTVCPLPHTAGSRPLLQYGVPALELDLLVLLMWKEKLLLKLRFLPHHHCSLQRHIAATDTTGNLRNTAIWILLHMQDGGWQAQQGCMRT